MRGVFSGSGDQIGDPRQRIGRVRRAARFVHCRSFFPQQHLGRLGARQSYASARPGGVCARSRQIMARAIACGAAQLRRLPVRDHRNRTNLLETMIKAAVLAVALLIAPRAVPAQEHVPVRPPAGDAQLPGHKQLGPADILMPHLTDSKHLEYPCFRSWSDRVENGVLETGWGCELKLPSWNVHIAGKTIDFGPTKHTVFMFLSAVIVAVVLLLTAAAHKRHSHEVGRPRGFAAGLEATILYLRNEIYMPV